MAACFEKGSDLTVLVNGRVLGGVLRLRRRVKRGAQEIKEFLTDKPVALIPTEVYYIEMELRRAPGYPFDDAVETVTVTGGGPVYGGTREERRGGARRGGVHGCDRRAGEECVG